jgi:hypothetical protein
VFEGLALFPEEALHKLKLTQASAPLRG